jgi:hypothetical protein
MIDQAGGTPSVPATNRPSADCVDVDVNAEPKRNVQRPRMPMRNARIETTPMTNRELDDAAEASAGSL